MRIHIHSRWLVFSVFAAFAVATGCLAFATTARADPVLCPSTGHYYEYVPELRSWSNALAEAETRSFDPGDGILRPGYLVTVTSAQENDDCVRPILQAVGRATWIAASDAAVEGEWRWVAGPEAGIQFWSGGPPAAGGTPVDGEYSAWDTSPAFEPNNSSGGEAFAAERTNGNWNDTTGTTSFGCTVCGYVVEYSARDGG